MALKAADFLHTIITVAVGVLLLAFPRAFIKKSATPQQRAVVRAVAGLLIAIGVIVAVLKLLAPSAQ